MELLLSILIVLFLSVVLVIVIINQLISCFNHYVLKKPLPRKWVRPLKPTWANSCTTCNAQGKVPCPLCQPKSPVRSWWTYLFPRQRPDQKDCPKCNGSGHIVCPACEGNCYGRWVSTR